MRQKPSNLVCKTRHEAISIKWRAWGYFLCVNSLIFCIRTKCTGQGEVDIFKSLHTTWLHFLSVPLSWKTPKSISCCRTIRQIVKDTTASRLKQLRISVSQNKNIQYAISPTYYHAFCALSRRAPKISCYHYHYYYNYQIPPFTLYTITFYIEELKYIY